LVRAASPESFLPWRSWRPWHLGVRLGQLAASYRDIDVFCAHDEREYVALRGRA
jgi:hypothetical protein